MTTDDSLVLDIAELRMRYGANDVLRDVDLQARQGEVLCLLGPNGAGKSTTVEILEGLRVRSSGHVRVLGIDPARADERWRARVGIVLQSWRDHGRWRVRELLAHLGAYYREYSTQRIPRPWDVDELLATVGLTGQAKQKIKSLSGGQRRRLDVAIGIVGRPELLFLDEPTAGLDPQARREFHDLARRLSAEQETTILLTTHDLTEAEKLADRIAILTDGRILAHGTTAQLTEHLAAEGEVRWKRSGQAFGTTTRDTTGFARQLFEQYGAEIEELEVRRPSLEDAYLALVNRGGES